MKKLLYFFLPVLGMVALLGGCASKPNLSELEVELVKLERSADGSLVATLQFDNQSVYSLNIASSIHQLSLNGKPVGVLSITEPLGLVAEKPTQQTAVLKILGGASLAPGQATYQLSSTLTLLLYDEQKDVHKTTHTGTITVP
jgi:hypothetical protein